MPIEHEVTIKIRKVLITGLDNAGKSSIQDILKFLPIEAAQRRIPSRDIEISKKSFLKSNFVFFIPPGQQDLREYELHGSMKEEYFKNVETFIFVFDSSDSQRVDEAKIELQRSIDDLIELSPECKSLLLFAHKKDLENSVSSLIIKEKLLDPLKRIYPKIISRFKIYETTIYDQKSIHEVFVKAIAQHVGTNRINFDKLADWIRKQANAKIVLITDHDGLLIGESFIGKEKSSIYAAYVAKIFAAVENYQSDLEAGGIKMVVLEDEDGRDYSIVSRINCTKDDYLALLLGYPKTQMGMAKIINNKGLTKLKEAYRRYRVV